MNKHAKTIKNRLESIIKDITENSHLYVKNPEKDFTRNRKLSFEEVFKILLSIGGNSLKIELMEYFSYDVEKITTTSAFIQQREKIKLEAFQELFERFTEQFEKPKTHKGYRLLAVDGSSFCISRNSNDEKTYIKNGEDSKGYNLIHLNALYDLENRIYVGALIQNGRELNEKQALIDIVKKSNVEGKVIVIGDRNYESYNIFENVREKNWNYVIRLKDIESTGISSSLVLPKTEIFDEEINLLITRRQTKEIKNNRKKYKFLPKNSNFDYLPHGEKGTYPMNFRIVRFPIAEGKYEVLVTNLSKDEFSIEELKELYHMRWGIETSFRELKYSIGLIHFHSKKVEHINQEIFAKLTMYNFCEIITTNVVIKQTERKYIYQVNFTIAISVCLRYFKSKVDIPSIDVEALIQMNILPVRKGRSDPRKVKHKSHVSFTYRVS